MPVDLSVFDRIKTKADFDRQAEEFAMKKQLQQAQLEEAQRKGTEFDLDKLGEQVLLKAAMGNPLTPEEMAVGKAYDAKRQQFYTDPSGNSVVKPPAFGSLTGAPQQTMGGYADNRQPMNTPSLPSSGNPEYDSIFQRQYQALEGNPRAQQDILSQFSTDVVSGKAQEKMRSEQDQFNRALDVKKKAVEALTRLDKNKSAVAAVSGPVSRMIPTFRNSSADAEADIEYVKNLMTTENLGLLKGVLSDTDMRVLASIGAGELSGSDDRVQGSISRMLSALSGQVQRAEPYAGAGGLPPLMSGLSQEPPLAPALGQRFPDVANGQQYDNMGVMNEDAFNAPVNPPKANPPMSKMVRDEALFNARKAIKNGKNRDAVIQRLIDNGIDPSGL